MAELFVWDKIIKKFEEKHGSDISGFLFENSKLIELKNNHIIIKLDPLSHSLLNDKNNDLFISLKKSIDDLLHDDIDIELVTCIEEIKKKKYLNVGEERVEISDWNYEDTCLNPSFTFKNYFYSYDNRKAIDAANQVIKNINNPDIEVSYNPFFIYGASGIGKTHFVNAIGNEIFSQNPNLKLLCKNATEFLNEYTSLFKGSLNTKKLDDFKEKYFNLDVFIIDDIQMLATKEGSLNEFFSIFESMRLKNKYLIITCDVKPRELSFEERLLTRFLSGLVLEIHFPDSDTKTQIFKYHAHKSNILIEESAIQIFINSSENVRELLGYINSIKIDMISKDEDDNREFKEEDAIEIVNKTTDNSNKITKKDIMKIISNYFDITMEDLTSKNRSSKNVTARNFCVFFLKDKLNLTFVEIAKSLGMKDHSNAVKIYNKFGEFKNKNEKSYKTLSQKINNKK